MAQAMRMTIGNVYIEGRLKDASHMLRQVLSNAFNYDTADRLFLELKSLGFTPAGFSVIEDTASVFITDPNIGQVRLCCHHIQVPVH
jgi:hypothetical protein